MIRLCNHEDKISRRWFLWNGMPFHRPCHRLRCDSSPRTKNKTIAVMLMRMIVVPLFMHHDDDTIGLKSWQDTSDGNEKGEEGGIKRTECSNSFYSWNDTFLAWYQVSGRRFQRDSSVSRLVFQSIFRILFSREELTIRQTPLIWSKCNIFSPIAYIVVNMHRALMILMIVIRVATAEVTSDI